MVLLQDLAAHPVSSCDVAGRLPGCPKDANHQFLRETREGAEASPFEGQAILDTVYPVYAPYFETSGSLKPGEMLSQVIALDAPLNEPKAWPS